MITVEDYKKALGQAADNIPEEELMKVMEIQDELAEILYVIWSEDRIKRAIIEKQCQEMILEKKQSPILV